MEDSKFLEAQTSVGGSSPPHEAPTAAAHKGKGVPECPVCHESFRYMPEMVKPHVRSKHPEMFNQLYPRKGPILGHAFKGHDQQYDANAARKIPSRSNRVRKKIPRLWDRSDPSPPVGTGPCALAQEPMGAVSGQDMSITPSYEQSRHSFPTRDLFDAWGVLEEWDWAAEAIPDAARANEEVSQEGRSEAGSAKLQFGFDFSESSNSSDIKSRLDTKILHGTKSVTEKVSDSPSVYGVVTLDTDERSNDGISSRPSETSTPDSSCFWLPEYSEDEEERLRESHPFMRFKTLAVDTVVKAFGTWRENNGHQHEPCDGTDEAYDASDRDKGKGKGKGKDAPTKKRTSTDQSETGNGSSEGKASSSQTASRKRRRTSDRKLPFACPYVKKDPTSYRDCYKYTLNRIRDVKQHLARRHQRPLYCPRCMETFENEGERDGHAREALCPLQPSITLDGITESQRKQLGQRSASNASEEAQWFAVFDILFPGHGPRPESPYIDRELLQDLTLLRDFSTTHGPRIVSEVLNRHDAVTWNLSNEEGDLAAFQQAVLAEGLREIFDRWVARGLSGNSSSELGNITSSSGNANNLTPLSSEDPAEMAGSGSRQAAGVPTIIPGREPTNTLPGSDVVQGASSSQHHCPDPLEWSGDFDWEHFDLEGLDPRGFDFV